MSPPVVVEVEIGTWCNLSCPYCPNSVLPHPEKAWISPHLFGRIIGELAEMGFSGRFSFHLYNEPLLHRGLEDLVKMVKVQLPRTRLVVFTNGTGLSDRRYRTLTEAGVEEFVVTRHTGAPCVSPRPHQTMLTPENLRITNRGGLLGNLAAPLLAPCYAPMEMLIVTCRGEVLQCFEDARRRRVMGDLNHQTLREIWFGDTFLEVRDALRRGRRDLVTELCALCDNQDYPKPGLTTGIICKN